MDPKSKAQEQRAKAQIQRRQSFANGPNIERGELTGREHMRRAETTRQGDALLQLEYNFERPDPEPTSRVG